MSEHGPFCPAFTAPAIGIFPAIEVIGECTCGSSFGVHATHCCVRHWCKYGEDDTCPVMDGTVEGLSPEGCEWCGEDRDAGARAGLLTF